MKRLAIALCVVILGLAVGTAVLSAEWFKLEGVKRLERNLYRSSSKVFIETRYCYHYAYGEDALYNDSTMVIVWEDGDKCDVKRIFK